MRKKINERMNLEERSDGLKGVRLLYENCCEVRAWLDDELISGS